MTASDAMDTACDMGTKAMSQARDMGTNAMSHASEYGTTALETVEQTVTNIPANAFLTAAFASIGVSLALKVTGHDRHAKFIGQWAPTLVGLAVFTRLVSHARSTHG